jgi:hypothetical protein
MNNLFIARNLAYYPGIISHNNGELSDEIILPAYHLNNLMREFEDDEMLYINMTNTNTNQSYLVAIGSSHSYDKNTIFAPQWILDLIGCSGSCDSVIQIAKADVSAIPVATKIVIKPLDPIAFELDTLACFETALMNIHSIREEITIPVNIPQLGNDYTLFAHIEKVEPGGLARIVNGEVNVEFINEFENEHMGEHMGQNTVKEEINTTITPITTSINDSPFIHPSYFSRTIPSLLSPNETINPEERRRQIREAWLKKDKEFKEIGMGISSQNNAKEK